MFYVVRLFTLLMDGSIVKRSTASGRQLYATIHHHIIGGKIIERSFLSRGLNYLQLSGGENTHSMLCKGKKKGVLWTP